MDDNVLWFAIGFVIMIIVATPVVVIKFLKR